MRLHVFGASGSGTTTLGRHLARMLDLPHFDTDDFFWLPSDPPFTAQRPVPERRRLLEARVLSQPGWVLSGSLCGWGDFLRPHFSQAIWLQLDPELRMQRLAVREAQRYGERIGPGGDMHAAHLAFMDWARQYDTGSPEVRSLALHEAWSAELACPLHRLDSSRLVQELLAALQGTISL